MYESPTEDSVKPEIKKFNHLVAYLTINTLTKNNVNTKYKRLIDWSLAALVTLLFVGSSIGKITGNEDALKMAVQIGLDASTFKLLGILELSSAILFLIPRTGILGTLLLAAYMGGAIAVHLSHGISIMAPTVIEAIIWIAAIVRFPELKARILGQNA